ncbi:hypothetical protein, partial [Gemmiger sp.]|uniref:hypothetical protein n=1 Tax=Gemmiger sp. TaxID=2049027 RepID=UPI0025C1A658
MAPVVPLFWNIRDKVILKVLLRVLARQNPNFLSCAVPAQRSTNIILYSLGNTAQFPPYGLSTAPTA